MNTQGLAARRAALSLIEAAMSRRGGIDEGLTVALAELQGRDRAFARSLAMTVMRRWGVLTRMLDARLHKPPPEPVSALLRLGAAQALFMDVPDHAAVATTLDLAQAEPASRPFKGLINGVLRGLVREPPSTLPEHLAPEWLLARWQAAYGREAARETALEIANEPPTDVSVKDGWDAQALSEALEARVLPGGSLRTGLRGEIPSWPGYAEGRWWIQDAAAAIPARFLKARPSEIILDLCAAPGGKTLQLAAAGAKVTAVDRSASRLKRLRENLDRTGLTAEVVAEPAEAWEDARTFDAVLLDAPCSATGTFRRQPEVLWLARPADIAKLAEVQARLLDVAAGKTRPGGRLVYCVCSLEPEEGEAQADGFLRRHRNFRLDPIQITEGGAPAASLREDGTLRILPHHLDGGMDGFFVARFGRET